MTTTNDITGDRLVSKTTKAYRDNYDKVDNSWLLKRIKEREQREQKTTRTS